jgi:hypothetical protein
MNTEASEAALKKECSKSAAVERRQNSSNMPSDDKVSSNMQIVRMAYNITNEITAIHFIGQRLLMLNCFLFFVLIV